jgi:glucose dehydrogenase
LNISSTAPLPKGTKGRYFYADRISAPQALDEPVGSRARNGSGGKRNEREREQHDCRTQPRESATDRCLELFDEQDPERVKSYSSPTGKNLLPSERVCDKLTPLRLMRRSLLMHVSVAAILAVGLVRTAPGTFQTTSAASGDWPMYRHDLTGSGYSSLTQIDRGNVARLRPIWTYRLQTPNSEATPIVVSGAMYLPAAGRIVALDPDTGREIWQHPIADGTPSRRGVAYWRGSATDSPRVLFTAGRRLRAVTAANGELVKGFGTDGEVDMVTPYNSVPLVYRNLIVVGANTPPGAIGGIGNPRAYDARTGAKLWEFSAVAQPGTPGHDTWEGDSWKNRLGVNAWPFFFTVDESRGLLYLPLASPIPGDFGGDRPGANLFGNSVVAVDVQTGRYRWHFQTIHHDLWDHDPPSPPGLFDLVRNGSSTPALALTTKSGYVYILNRETGEPIFGVEERAVPKSDVPGEVSFPTQPFPLKPPPLARVAYTPRDLVLAEDTTPDHATACADLVARLGGVYNAGPFTPWRVAGGSSSAPTLNFPGTLGGVNWGGTAFDPQSRYLVTASQDVGALGVMEKAAAGSRSGAPYDKVTPGGGRGTFDIRTPGGSWPCQKPPWGRLTAIDTATGEFAWQVPLGVTDNLPPGKQNTGRPALAGPIVTASGLIFIASTDDNRFRALDVKTGRELWVTRLDRRGNANPMTYQGRTGKQYVAVVATDTLAVYALP